MHEKCKHDHISFKFFRAKVKTIYYNVLFSRVYDPSPFTMRSSGKFVIKRTYEWMNEWTWNIANEWAATHNDGANTCCVGGGSGDGGGGAMKSW